MVGEQLPQHVAVVMDGNGRWAQNRQLARVEGHIAGVEAVRKIIRCCLEKHIPYLSLFAFSSENWSRPANEVDFLMELFATVLNQEIEHFKAHGVMLRFTGDKAALPALLQEKMAQAQELTQHNSQLVVSVGFNYGGRWDVLNAAKKMARALIQGACDWEDLDEAYFEQFLDTHGLPSPDLLIRTSGELRISNFYLWQLAYTELYFTSTLWPDFDEVAFDEALAAFTQRQRRYGRLES